MSMAGDLEEEHKLGTSLMPALEKEMREWAGLVTFQGWGEGP